jgi:hypothetical protein
MAHPVPDTAVLTSAFLTFKHWRRHHESHGGKILERMEFADVPGQRTLQCSRCTAQFIDRKGETNGLTYDPATAAQRTRPPEASRVDTAGFVRPVREPRVRRSARVDPGVKDSTLW